jgi:hypothetical protein
MVVVFFQSLIKTVLNEGIIIDKNICTCYHKRKLHSRLTLISLYKFLFSAASNSNVVLLRTLKVFMAILSM